MKIDELIEKLQQLREVHSGDVRVMTSDVRGRTENAARDVNLEICFLQKAKPGVTLRRFLRPGDCPCIAGEQILKL